MDVQFSSEIMICDLLILDIISVEEANKKLDQLMNKDVKILVKAYDTINNSLSNYN